MTVALGDSPIDPTASKEHDMAASTPAKKTAAAKKPAAVRKVAVIGGNRIPFARSNTVYAGVSNQEMLTAALDGLIDRFDLDGEVVGEFVAGAVLKHSRDFNLARETVLGSKLAPETTAYDLQQACGTGLQAAFQVANKIALGKYEVGIAGGTDTTSDAPLAVGDKLRKILIELNQASAKGDKKKMLQLISKIRPAYFAPDQPRNAEPRTGLSMGDHQAITTHQWGITREAQDELAAASHQNLAKAWDEGWQDDLVTPFHGVDKDNHLRPDSTVEKLAKLKPAFGKRFGDEATMTAGNSTPLSDGASVALFASEEEAKKRGWKVRAYLTDYETAAVDYVSGAEGLLMAPAYAVPRMLARNGLTLQDFDFYEIHEAFAGQVLSTLAAWEDADFCKDKLGLDSALGSIDRKKLNVKGSSLAAAHPFAATGARIVANAAKLLDQKGSGRALISICAAGGQGVVAILEK
jgi:acetyl-CoA C-acetyltransferase